MPMGRKHKFCVVRVEEYREANSIGRSVIVVFRRICRLSRQVFGLGEPGL
jgi:hypothetical protein